MVYIVYWRNDFNLPIVRAIFDDCGLADALAKKLNAESSGSYAINWKWMGVKFGDTI